MSDDDAPMVDVDVLVDMVWDLADHVPAQLRADVVDRAFQLIEAQGIDAHEHLRDLFERACQGAKLPPRYRPRRVPPVNPVNDYRHTLRRRPRPAADGRAGGAAVPLPNTDQSTPPAPATEPPLPPPSTSSPPFGEQPTDPRFDGSETYFEKLARDVHVVSGRGADFSDPQRTRTRTLVTRERKKRKKLKGKRREGDR